MGSREAQEAMAGWVTCTAEQQEHAGTVGTREVTLPSSEERAVARAVA